MRPDHIFLLFFFLLLLSSQVVPSPRSPSISQVHPGVVCICVRFYVWDKSLSVLKSSYGKDVPFYPVLVDQFCLSGMSLRGTNTHRPRPHRRTRLIDKCTPPRHNSNSSNSTPPNTLPSSNQTSHTANLTLRQTRTARSSLVRASASH